MCNIILQSFKSCQLYTFLFKSFKSFSKVELLLIHSVNTLKNRKWPLKESFVLLYNFYLKELKEYGLKNYALVWKSLIDFNEAFVPYSELQFFDSPSIVAHPPAGLMYTAYGQGFQLRPATGDFCRPS